MKTFVYVDHFKGEVQPASWEALGVAKTLGTASAVILGSDLQSVAKMAFEFGADEVLLAEDAALQDYRVEPYVICADIYSRPPYVRRGGWTWYTGSAAWMYRLGLEAILGFRMVARR